MVDSEYKNRSVLLRMSFFITFSIIHNARLCFSFIQGVKELEHLNETGELKILLENFEVRSSVSFVRLMRIVSKLLLYVKEHQW